MGRACEYTSGGLGVAGDASGVNVARGLAVGVLLALCVAWAGPGFGQAKDAKKAEAELKAVRAEIERVARQLRRDQVERDRLAKELRAAEMSVSSMRESLEEVRKQRAAHAQKRAQLAAEKRQREAELSKERSSLADQLRAAYLIGHEEPLKLLLNQKDPARVGRMFAYYSYFGRARAEQIARITSHLERLAALDAEMAEEDARLAELEAQRRAELQKLDAARAERGRVLASLKTEARNREQSLQRLKREQAALEKLLAELKRAMERFPPDTSTVFGKLRGKLAWPVSGKLVAQYGESRAGGVKWDGVLVATERGTPVRAVASGRVVYADWLPGLGLLTIIDHGDGYLSLYGHNERLFKAAGEQVSSGEPIAAAGDSGGRPRAEVYFEIRKGGKPIDPRPWFSSRTPPS